MSWHPLLRSICARGYWLLPALVWIPVLPLSNVYSAEVTLAWDPNTEPDLAGYRIYYGPSSRGYTDTLDVGHRTQYTIPDLQESVFYFFAVTAYDLHGNESAFSKEVSFGVPRDGIDEPDLDRDGDVDMEDFFLFAGMFGCTCEEACYDSLADMDGDCEVDLDDFHLFAEYSGDRQAKLAALGRFLSNLPLSPMLYQNRPNPFNAITIMAYDLPEACDVRLVVYSVTGQQVGTLVSEHQKAGHYEVMWDGSEYGDGIYFYRLEAGESVQIRRMMLIR